MKKIVLAVAIVTGVILITSCQWFEEIGKPIIITPITGPTIIESSEEEGDQIKFMWHLFKNATGYAMEIAEDDSFDNLLYSNQAITDTFHYVSADSFQWDETYYWRVRAAMVNGWGIWSDVASLCKKLPGVDLDTTYFPFGLGYEWCYARHSWQHVSDPEWPSWDKYDTFTVRVTDSFWSEDTLCFQLKSGIFGISNPARILYNTIDIFGETITLNPQTEIRETDEPWGWGEFEVSYLTDTLLITVWGPDPYDEGTEHWGSTRLKSLGALHQGRHYSGYSVGVSWNDGFSDKLLYFYNGTDTVYKVPDWEG